MAPTSNYMVSCFRPSDDCDGGLEQSSFLGFDPIALISSAQHLVGNDETYNSNVWLAGHNIVDPGTSATWDDYNPSVEPYKYNDLNINYQAPTKPSSESFKYVDLNNRCQAPGGGVYAASPISPPLVHCHENVKDDQEVDLWINKFFETFDDGGVSPVAHARKHSSVWVSPKLPRKTVSLKHERTWEEQKRRDTGNHGSCLVPMMAPNKKQKQLQDVSYLQSPQRMLPRPVDGTSTQPRRVSPLNTVALHDLIEPVQHQEQIRKQEDILKSLASYTKPISLLDMIANTDNCTQQVILRKLKDHDQPALLLMTSLPFRILYANEAYGTVTGRKNVVGNAFDDMFPSDLSSRQCMSSFRATPLGVVDQSVGVEKGEGQERIAMLRCESTTGSGNTTSHQTTTTSIPGPIPTTISTSSSCTNSDDGSSLDGSLHEFEDALNPSSSSSSSEVVSCKIEVHPIYSREEDDNANIGQHGTTGTARLKHKNQKRQGVRKQLKFYVAILDPMNKSPPSASSDQQGMEVAQVPNMPSPVPFFDW